jgi:hypothetical protein
VGGRRGVAHVQVGLGRRLDSRAPSASGARCSWLDPARRAFTPGRCRKPIWFAAAGSTTWRVGLPSGLLGAGRYVVTARARQKDGPLESRLVVGRNLRLFAVSG